MPRTEELWDPAVASSGRLKPAMPLPYAHHSSIFTRSRKHMHALAVAGEVAMVAALALCTEQIASRHTMSKLVFSSLTLLSSHM